MKITQDLPVRVLLADSDSGRRSVLLRELLNAGFDVHGCATAREALIGADGFKPEAFLIEIILSDQTAYGFARSLRKQPQFSKAPIVVYTAHGEMQPSSMELSELGIEGFLHWPFQAKQFTAVLL